ncbi:hypothetical protein [Streptacidiphilus sp. MAP5-3]|uniref:hypothetical protein n=1 Tax=unclassified Streptacidiphilus TaxID=2643834 RepID=UPI0035184F1E
MQASYITELFALVRSLEASNPCAAQTAVLKGVDQNLKEARTAAHHGFRSAEECVYTNICSAETGLLRVVPDRDLPAWVPTVHQAVCTYLPTGNKVRKALEEAIKAAKGTDPPAKGTDSPQVSRELLVNAFEAAYYADSVEKRRAASFRSIVLGGAAVLTLLAAGLVFTSYGDQPMIRLCFPASTPQACPTGYLPVPPVAAGTITAKATATAAATSKATASSDPDPGTATTATTARATATAVARPNTQSVSQDPVDSEPDMPDQEFFDVLIVEIFGLMAAALTAAVALRKMPRKRPPYWVPLSLAILKLPAGAVSAVLGVTLINAGLIPGLDKLETPNQILTWAALFGASQQALTRFVDKKGKDVLRLPGGGKKGRKS